ncbi:hypothetical protein ACU4I5_05775 [Ensifer adhaerens]
MADMRITERQVEDFGRFMHLMPHGRDLTLVILKGHLLIEEQVRHLVRAQLKKPEALDDAQLDCHQAICLAEALCPQSDDLWKSVRKLNKIRNDIAHKVIPPDGLHDRMAAFAEATLPDAEAWGSDAQSRFEFALWFLFNTISLLVEPPDQE